MPFRKILIPLLWTTITISAAKGLPTNLKDLPPQNSLPDLFKFNDGTKVTSLAEWKERRKELVEPLMFYQYGSIPPRPDEVTFRTDKEKNHSSGIGKEHWLTLIIGSKRKLEMRIVIYEPKTPGPHPVIIEEEGSLGGSKNAERFMKKNYLFIEYARHDLDPDRKNTAGPAQKAYPEHDWETLAVWAWGGMRVVDYLEGRNDVDMQSIAITGHSRGGKMALLAGALDERISLVIPNGSGAGGAGSSRILGPGAESIGMNDKPHWYHPRIRIFAEKEAHLPFDQHFLKALVAPRGLLCIESTDDLYANPLGTYATSNAAMPVYELYNMTHRTAIRFRRGGHTFSEADWTSLLDFAELTFYDKAPVDGQSFWQIPAEVTPSPDSGGSPGFVKVGNTQNKGDYNYPRVGSFGSVNHEYEIGQYKVSNAEYSIFLNQAAHKSDPDGLFNSKMRIRKELKDGKFIYHPYPATANAAVTYVSWFDALKYCNWLGESYLISDQGRKVQRKANAKYYLPTEDEWYKACYYDPKNKKYKLYPLRDAHRIENSNKLPSKSSYGMMETSDHIWEWTESKVGEAFRGIRSDSWFQGNNRQAAGRYYSNPDLELGHLGFRVARPASAGTKKAEIKNAGLLKRARRFGR
jgi:hypothetical protein